MATPSWKCCYSSIDELGLGTPCAVESAADAWLSAEEQEGLAHCRSGLRRRSWVAGRIAAKRLLMRLRLLPAARAAEITIVSRDDRGRGVVPTVRVAGRMQPTSLSISHTERGVLVAASLDMAVRVGVDLAVVGDYGPGFRRLWFSEQERSLMQRSGGRLTPAVLWAAKEAAYKTLGEGEPFMPRQIEAQMHEDGFLGCKVQSGDGRSTCRLADWRVDGHVACLALRTVAGCDVPQMRTQDLLPGWPSLTNGKDRTGDRMAIRFAPGPVTHTNPDLAATSIRSEQRGMNDD